MEGQNFAHPSFAMQVSKNNATGNLMNKNGEFYCIETQKELIYDEVKSLLIKVCSQEEYFVTKFEIAPMGRTSQLTFLIKVNSDQVFEKSLSELISFCSELNIWAEGKNTNIEQLYLMIQDNFQL